MDAFSPTAIFGDSRRRPSVAVGSPALRTSGSSALAGAAGLSLGISSGAGGVTYLSNNPSSLLVSESNAEPQAQGNESGSDAGNGTAQPVLASEVADRILSQYRLLSAEEMAEESFLGAGRDTSDSEESESDGDSSESPPKRQAGTSGDGQTEACTESLLQKNAKQADRFEEIMEAAAKRKKAKTKFLSREDLKAKAEVGTH